MTIKVGCSGFQEARSKYYAEFPLVEIQQTFFQPPPVGTALKWKAQAPSNFEFTVKAWQLITHDPVSNTYRNLKEKLSAREIAGCGSFKPTRMVFEAWNRTEAVANALGAKIIVFQLPKNFRPDPISIKNMRNFFKRIRRGKYQIVWEPNHRWSPDLVQNLSTELDLVYTSSPFSANPPNIGPIHYYRLNGKNGFRSRYNDTDFTQLKEFGNNGVPSYFIFNNASMLFDARNFRKLLSNSEKSPETETTPISAEPEAVELAEEVSGKNAE